jgi:NhaP-type Na+/H+ or K+/H+ antiporter
MGAGRDWGYLAILYVFVQLSRVVVVGLLYPGLKYFGYGLNWKEAVVLVWAGLRGAVALSLSLSVAVSTHVNSKRSC